MALSSKFLTRSVFLFCFAFAGLTSSASADSTPEGTLKVMVSKMQESHLNLLEFVDWPTAFNSLAPREKQSLRVKSPEEMQKFYVSMFSDPRAFYESQLKGKIGNLTQEQQAVVDKQIDHTVSLIEEKVKSEQDRIRRSKYDIGEASIKGNMATIPLSATLDGETRKEQVELIKVNGQWKLPQLALIKGKKKRPINSALPKKRR